MIDASITVWPEDESLWILPRDENLFLEGNRFSDEWMEKVEKWAAGHAVMIERYGALLQYRKMQEILRDVEFNEWEMEQFHRLEGSRLNLKSHCYKGDWPGDDLDSDDWEDPISHQAVAESE